MNRPHRSPLRALLVLASVAATAATAAAQPPADPPWHSHGFVSGDVGVQVASPSFASHVAFRINVEAGTLDARYDAPAAPFVAGRAGVRLWRDLAVGIGVSGTSRTETAAVDAQLPHPFFFGQPRAVSGTASSLTRGEVGVHVEVSYRLPLTPRVDLMVFGGPSVINVRQQLVTMVRYSEAYPFDTATYTGADWQSFSKAAVGFNLGADVTCYVTRTVGVGGLLRYSRATLSLEPVSGQQTTLVAGGLQLGGGLRVRF